MNLIPVRLGILAEWIVGQSGWSQTRQLRKVVVDLADFKVVYRLHRPGEYATRTGPLISLVPVTDDLNHRLKEDGIRRRTDLVIRFADELFESLMVGRYQRIQSRARSGSRQRGLPPLADGGDLT